MRTSFKSKKSLKVSGVLTGIVEISMRYPSVDTSLYKEVTVPYNFKYPPIVKAWAYPRAADSTDARKVRIPNWFTSYGFFAVLLFETSYIVRPTGITFYVLLNPSFESGTANFDYSLQYVIMNVGVQ